MAGATLVAQGTDNIADFDAGPLSWVQGEIDEALARGLDALETFAAVPGDATPLKHARTHIHQAAGAIQMVGLEAVAAFTDEVERQLARLDELPAPEVAALCATIDRACRKLRIFLDELVSGAPPVPLKLFPEYEAMQRARGVRATAPTDLFYPDLSAPPPRLAGVALPAAQMPSFLVKQRRVFQRGLLAWLRGSAEGAHQMREVIRAIEGVTGQASLRSFWWTVGALIDALQERGLESSFGVKQLAARIDLQIRRLAEGSAKVADRLRREVLYFVAISAPVAPSVMAVQKSFRLGGLIPSAEVLHADLVRIQPHLREARDLLAQAKDTWLKFTSGRAENLPKLKQSLAAVHQHATQTGNGALMKLTSTLVARLDRMSAGNVSEPVAMEYATALLLADSAFQNFGKLSGEFAHHVDAMLGRLDAAQAARPFDGAAAPVLEEMSRRAQDRMLLAQVGREIQANLRHMEQVLDAFFRDHGRHNELAALVKDSAQVRGALRMLDLQTAEALLASCEEQIASYADPATPITDEDLELLAESLSGLGFYIEAVEQQRADHERLIRPLLAKRRGEAIAAPEEETDTLEAAVAEMREALPALVAEVHRAPADMAARTTLRERLTVLRDDAELIGDVDLVAQAKAALQELEALGMSAPAGGALAALAELPEPSAAPEVSQETQRLLATEDHALDAELLDIFLTEAAEVLDTVVEQHRILSHNPADREALRTARRQFHTLKGSGRMVGLTALGEIAYDVEKIHNRLLEEERAVTPAVLGLIETGEVEFRRWVGELRASGHVAVDPEPLHAAIRNVEAELPGSSESVLKGRDAGVSITSAPPRADAAARADVPPPHAPSEATPAVTPATRPAAPAVAAPPAVHEIHVTAEPEISDADALASVLAAYRGAEIELPAEMLGASAAAGAVSPADVHASNDAPATASNRVAEPAAVAPVSTVLGDVGDVGHLHDAAVAPVISFAEEGFDAIELDAVHAASDVVDTGLHTTSATTPDMGSTDTIHALHEASRHPVELLVEPPAVDLEVDGATLADADALPALFGSEMPDAMPSDTGRAPLPLQSTHHDASAPDALRVGAHAPAGVHEPIAQPADSAADDAIAPATSDDAAPAAYAPSSAESMLDELAEALALDAAALEPTIDLELPAVDEPCTEDASTGADSAAPDEPIASDEITVGGVTLARALYDILVVEAEEHLATLGHELAVMQFDPAYGVSAAMVRASHTLCGIHRTGGFALVPPTAKALEQCLIALQGRDEALSEGAQAVIAEAIDVLGLLVARVRDREAFDGRDVDDAERVQARLEALRQQYDQEPGTPETVPLMDDRRHVDGEEHPSATHDTAPDAEAMAGLSSLLASVAAELAQFESGVAPRGEPSPHTPTPDTLPLLDAAKEVAPLEALDAAGDAAADAAASSAGEPASLLDMDVDGTDGTVDALIESALAELTAEELETPAVPAAAFPHVTTEPFAASAPQSRAPVAEPGAHDAAAEGASAEGLASAAPAEPSSSLDALWAGHSAASNDDGAASAAAAATAPDVVPAAVHTPLDQIKDEVDEQLLPIFLEEAEELFPQAGEQLRAWRRAPDDATHGSALRRTLHTFKGSARMAGAMRLGELAHRMESRLLRGDELATGTAELFEALDGDLDRVAFVLDALREGRTNVSTPWLDVAEPALAAAEVPAADVRGAATHEVSGVVVPLPGVAAPFATAEPAARTPAEELRPAAETDAGGQRAMLRVRADVIDRLVNEAGEVAIARARVEGELRALKNNLLELTNSVIRMRAQVREIEIQAESQIQSRLSVRNEGNPDFDPLEFDRFTRFQELTRSLAEGINDVSTVQQSLLRNVDDADAALVAQARLSRDVQQQLFAIRTVPFNSLSERLYRILRQVAKELDKRVNLDIRGAQVELDRSVLEKLVGPLEHLLRNALDHGVESRDARVAAGKSAVGEIVVTVRQLGNEIAIELADDGAGLDFERIRARAIGQGRIAADAVTTEAELIECIFQPGFSTATRVTHVSGRGIGMDVVRSEIAALGGRVEVTSRPGHGTSFTLYLPLTLAVAQAVLVRAGGRLWALPAPMVEQVQQVKTDNLVEFYASRRIRWQGRTYPFHYLPRLLGDVEHTPITARFNPVLLLRTGQGFAAVHVDEMIGNQEVVVKNIGPQLARVSGIAGATVLGTGEIVLIINPVQLAQRPQVPGFDPGAEERVVASQANAPGVRPPMAMIVDDSLTVRKITSRLLTREGFEVVTAKDGLEALQRLDEARPDVILLDIEMPRMDGFEFTKTIKADARHAHIPIVMITSRTAEKHRNRARELGVDLYLGKPYQEQELLQTLREMLSVTA